MTWLVEKLKSAYPDLKIIPCSADSELALREAANAKLIEYIPGDSDFKIIGNLNEKQKLALENIRTNVLKPYKSTGVQDILNSVIFDLLKYITIFPASASLSTR